MKHQSHIRQAVIDTHEIFALVQARMMEFEIGQDHPHYAELLAIHMQAICEMLKLSLTSTTEPATHCHPLPRSPDRKALSLRVIAADDFTPVPDVDVSLTWVGSGCDGGSHSGTAITDKDGVVNIPDGFLNRPGPSLSDSTDGLQISADFLLRGDKHAHRPTRRHILPIGFSNRSCSI